MSIGNQAANQLPSKLYEYIAAGKPLLHLAAGPDDAALGLLRRWPLALALDPGAPDAADTLRAWLEKNAGRTLPFSEAAARFPENTPAAVAETALDPLPVTALLWEAGRLDGRKITFSSAGRT